MEPRDRCNMSGTCQHLEMFTIGLCCLLENNQLTAGCPKRNVTIKKLAGDDDCLVKPYVGFFYHYIPCSLSRTSSHLWPDPTTSIPHLSLVHPPPLSLSGRSGPSGGSWTAAISGRTTRGQEELTEDSDPAGTSLTLPMLSSMSCLGHAFI